MNIPEITVYGLPNAWYRIFANVQADNSKMFSFASNEGKMYMGWIDAGQSTFRLVKELPSKGDFVYRGLGSYQLSFKIPTSGYSLLINYGAESLEYVDSSRLEKVVQLKTPYGDAGAYMVYVSPEWTTKTNILSYKIRSAGEVAIECIGDTYSTGDRLRVSYLTIGYIL